MPEGQDSRLKVSLLASGLFSIRYSPNCLYADSSKAPKEKQSPSPKIYSLPQACEHICCNKVDLVFAFNGSIGFALRPWRGHRHVLMEIDSEE